MGGFQGRGVRTQGCKELRGIVEQEGLNGDVWEDVGGEEVQGRDS